MIGPMMAAEAVIAAGIGDRILAVARHHADDDPADADGVGDRRAGHAGEDDVRHDVDVPEAAAKASHEHEAELQQPVGEAAGVHQVGGEDEQRHRQQHVAVEEAVQDLLGRGAEIEPGEEQVEDRRADHRQADRQAERRQHDQHDDAQREMAGHRHGVSVSRAVSLPACAAQAQPRERRA